MSRHIVLPFWALFFCWCFSMTAGQCTFPTNVQGTWTTSSHGDITISTSAIDNFPIGSFGNKILDCNSEYGSRYILKTQSSFNAIGQQMFAYLCIDFTNVSPELNYYYLASNITSGDRIVYRVSWSTPTSDEVCALSTSQYDKGEYQVMIKNGDGAAAKQTCPLDFETFWSYSIDSGSGNGCPSGAQLDGCTYEKQLTANYTVCSARTFYSDSGVVYCLNSVTSGALTYLTVYNTDVTVDNTNTFRTACLVYQASGDDLQVTQHPGVCDAGQTPTSVTTPTGSVLTMQNASPCPVVVEEPDMTIYYVLGVVGGLVVLIIIVLVIFIFFTWKAKHKPFRGRLEPDKPEVKTPRLQAFENGFKRYKQPGHADQQALSREGSPENDDEAPINVMQLLRKDIITPGGRDSPSSNVMLSVTTPNPYNYHDADSVGGNSLPIPAENPALKKHYHVIGGEPPSAVGLEEEDEDDFLASDGGGAPMPRSSYGGGPLSARSVRSTGTPVMVRPVKNPNNGLEDDEDDDDDDFSGDDDGLFDADGHSTLAAARQAVGISDAMCPASRLPPIDEGPSTHRSFTGAGNPSSSNISNNSSVALSISRRSSGQTATFSEQNPTIIEQDTPRSQEEGSDTPRSNSSSADHHHPHNHNHHPAASSSAVSSPRPNSSNTERRRSSLGLLYQLEGNTMVAIPDITEQVTAVAGTVSEGSVENKGRKEGTVGAGTVGTAVTTKGGVGNKWRGAGARLKPMARSAKGRRGSGLGSGALGLHTGVKSSSSSSSSSAAQGATAAAAAADAKKKSAARAKNRLSKQQELSFADDEELKPKSRVKLTRVDIPELLSPGELARRLPGDNELLESPGRSYYNAAYAPDVEAGAGSRASAAGGEGGDAEGEAARKMWLKPVQPTSDVWSKVSNLWRLGQAWPDKPT